MAAAFVQKRPFSAEFADIKGLWRIRLSAELERLKGPEGMITRGPSAFYATQRSSGLHLLLRPLILQRHSAIEHRTLRRGIRIHAEITKPLELKTSSM